MRKSVDVRALVGSFFVRRMRCAGEVAALLARRHRAILGRAAELCWEDLACSGLLLDIVPKFIGIN